MRDWIDAALAAVDKHVPDLHPDLLGMSTPRVRRLLRTLAGFLPSAEAYLEVGIHAGGTLIPALLGLPEVRAYACDNWSQFTQVGGEETRAVFFRNLLRYKAELPEILLIEADIFKHLALPSPFGAPIGLSFYDGGHQKSEQRRFLQDLYPHLAAESVVVIDDFERPEVREGTWEALAGLPLHRLHFEARSGPSNADRGFWCGLGIFHLTKEPPPGFSIA